MGNDDGAFGRYKLESDSSLTPISKFHESVRIGARTCTGAAPGVTFPAIPKPPPVTVFTMRSVPYLTVIIALTGAAEALAAQPTLRPALSGRATSVVTLAVPRDPAQPAAQPAAAPTTPPITIALDYGQPHLRGRTLHTDSLVPYGTPWRTGANDPTTLTTGVDLVVGGATLPAGKYVLYTIPSRDDWKLIIQKSAGQTAEYDPKHDVARVDLRRQSLTEPVESLTMWLHPVLRAREGPRRAAAGLGTNRRLHRLVGEVTEPRGRAVWRVPVWRDKL